MSNVLIGIGILLAIFGPLLLIPIIWIFNRLVTFKIINRICGKKFNQTTNNMISVCLSAVLVLLIVFITYLPGKIEYEALCSKYGTPSIQSRVITNSFYRTRLYPYEAKQFLGPDGFEYIEAPNMYKQGEFTRYSLTAEGNIVEEAIPKPISEYGIREELRILPKGITLSQKTAYELTNGKEFAQASNILYSGGPLSMLMGVYAMSDCPDIRTEEGSKHFNTFYNFERQILLGVPD